MGIIEINDLSYSYPNAKKQALDGINLKIKKGEFILLTGPSGCGKTTFCRCINGLIPKFYNGEFSGSIIVSGLNTLETPIMNLAQEVGLIFQNPDNQIFALTVEKDIAFGLENLGIPKNKMKQEIKWVTETTGIKNLLNRATHELSGGQKQRLTIASVLVMHPNIIIMDEPTSFLDPVGAEKIFEVLKFLNKEFGMTIILIEHRMDLAVKYVNRIIVFNNGKIVSDGPPKQVFKDESLRLLGVGIPRIIELTRLLKNKGLIDFKTPISAQEFYNQIQNKFKTKKIFSHDIPLDLKDLTGEYSHIPTLRVDNVSFSYPSGVKALHNVSLTINQGEYVAIMGENGAGKTTLVKHFNGLLKPLKGKIYYNKNDISTSSVASLAKKIGLVFQNPDDQLFEETVEKEISFALKNFGFQKEIINERVEWALNLLDLTEYRESSPFTLSGGERKRVALASVLAWDPDVLVLDEPTIGQDYGQKERLRHFLNQLRTQGKTIVIVTHDVEFVAESQPRIVLMAHGEIIGDGTSKKIMTNIKKLEESSVAQPEITRLFSLLQKHGYPNNILDVEEAYELLVNDIMEDPK